MGIKLKSLRSFDRVLETGVSRENHFTWRNRGVRRICLWAECQSRIRANNFMIPLWYGLYHYHSNNHTTVILQSYHFFSFLVNLTNLSGITTGSAMKIALRPSLWYTVCIKTRSDLSLINLWLLCQFIGFWVVPGIFLLLILLTKAYV